MPLQPLTLNDKPIFDLYAQSEVGRGNTPAKTPRQHTRLSSYAFTPLYIWRDHLAFYWVELAGHLCVFAKQNDDYFMPILPIPYHVSSCGYLNVVHEAYQFMLESSRNSHIARIENVPQEMLSLFERNGFCSSLKGTEYLYETAALGRLSGNRYKSKRGAYNAFVGRYPSATLTPYCLTDQDACFALYDTWRTERAAQCNDAVYCAMLDDSRSAHRTAIADAGELGLLGRVVRINGEVSGYTFGYPLNGDTFCVLFEVTDLRTKGLAQFIYREFCRELMGTYKWINAMDDSGLENLKRVKRSYHPTHLILSYNIDKPTFSS